MLLSTFVVPDCVLSVVKIRVVTEKYFLSGPRVSPVQVSSVALCCSAQRFDLVHPSMG